MKDREGERPMGEKRVLIATGNQGKLREFRRMLEPLGYQVVSPKEVGLQGLEVVEDGDTFAQNARKKAIAYYQASGLPSLADDSGLEVDALGGAPGIYSARYGTPDLDDQGRTALLLRNMEEVPRENRGAQFVCAICFWRGEGDCIQVQEICRGEIGYAPQGENGFGYDPVFLVEGGSFSQISPEQKDRISHRGKALRALCQRLREEIGGTGDVDK